MVDYQQNCQWIRVGTEWYCDCPLPPVWHSHIVANRCLPIEDGATCRATVGCDYECDVGYVWNPVTQTCDLIRGEPLMDGFMYIE